MYNATFNLCRHLCILKFRPKYTTRSPSMTKQKMRTLTKFKTILLPAAFIVTILAGTASCNNTEKPGNTSANADSTKSDTIKNGKGAQFLVKVAGINLEEIKLGQLAQQKSTMPDVKDMGKMMEDDHTKAESDLTALALKKSITIPSTLDTTAQADYQKLNSLSGSDFDKMYSDMMVNGHTVAIDLFEKESLDAGDTDIRQLAIATLPALQMHLNHALACQKKCGKK
jgi:putative membrane protein